MSDNHYSWHWIIGWNLFVRLPNACCRLLGLPTKRKHFSNPVG
jgi:hypothetical protein